MSILERNNLAPWEKKGAKKGPRGAKIGSIKPKLTCTNMSGARQNHPLEPAVVACFNAINGFLWGQTNWRFLVGVRGFEPPASTSRT